MRRVIVLVGVTSMLVGQPGAAVGEGALLSVLAGEVPAPSPAAKAAIRVRPHGELVAAGAARLRIDFPDRAAAVAERTDLERRTAGSLTWRGRLTTDPESSVTLTLHRGFLVGRISAADGIWELRTQPDGSHSFESLDGTRFAACGTLGEAAEWLPWREQDPDPCPDPVDPPDGIDLLGLYTSEAAAAAGGIAQIETTLQAAVDAANTAFANSQMVARFRLVHTAESSRHDSGNMAADLSWLAADPGVAALRDEVRADLVSLIVEAGGYCGIARLPIDWSAPASNQDDAFQVTARSCAVGNLSFAHEHGHNMGLEHDPANANPPGAGTYPFRFAHFHDGVYRTVMSYSNQCPSGCTRHPYFSNPDVFFMGLPTGIPDARDNHRAGNLTDACVTDYRLGILFGDDFETGDATGWSVASP